MICFVARVETASRVPHAALLEPADRYGGGGGGVWELGSFGCIMSAARCDAERRGPQDDLAMPARELMPQLVCVYQAKYGKWILMAWELENLL